MSGEYCTFTYGRVEQENLVGVGLTLIGDKRPQFSHGSGVENGSIEQGKDAETPDVKRA